VVLATALATNNLWVIAAQAFVFAIGAIKGPQFTPYAFIYKKIVKPRLKGETPTEDIRPPQFAQSVGLLFALTAIVGITTGINTIFIVAVAFALAAAFLNAAFNFCLGCEIYLLLLRARSK
jgi:Na+(H+)/acetate symporter ActP